MVVGLTSFLYYYYYFFLDIIFNEVQSSNFYRGFVCINVIELNASDKKYRLGLVFSSYISYEHRLGWVVVRSVGEFQMGIYCVDADVFALKMLPLNVQIWFLFHRLLGLVLIGLGAFLKWKFKGFMSMIGAAPEFGRALQIRRSRPLRKS